MKAEFVASKGRIATRPFHLEDGQKVCIGRGEDCEVQILDAGLSRRHTELEMHGDDFVLRDLGSRNGTWVNGVRVSETPLKDGDKVRLGGLEFVFRLPKERRRNNEVNLVASVPEDSGVEYREKVDPDQTSLMHLPDEFENVENYRRVQRDLSTVYRVGNLIHSERNEQRLYERVVDAIGDVIQADRCFLLLNRAEEAEKPDLSPVACRTQDEIDSSDNILFSSTVAEEAFNTGMCVLRSDVKDDARFASAESIISEGIKSVMCVPVESPDGIIGVMYVDTVGRSQGFRKHDLELLAAVGRQAGIAIRRMQLLAELLDSFYGTVSALVSTIEAKDQYTKGHSIRVTDYAMQIGRRLGLSSEDQMTLELASLLHDVGKIGIMESLLQKPGALTPEEFEIIKQHPDIGANIIRNIRNGEPISRVVRHHHERWDGSGYPGALKAEDIPQIARVLTVADTIDAMTSKRPYRDTPDMDIVLNTLKQEQGSQFDPKIAEMALAMINAGELKLEPH